MFGFGERFHGETSRLGRDGKSGRTRTSKAFLLHLSVYGLFPPNEGGEGIVLAGRGRVRMMGGI